MDRRIQAALLIIFLGAGNGLALNSTEGKVDPQDFFKKLFSNFSEVIISGYPDEGIPSLDPMKGDLLTTIISIPATISTISGAESHQHINLKAANDHLLITNQTLRFVSEEVEHEETFNTTDNLNSTNDQAEEFQPEQVEQLPTNITVSSMVDTWNFQFTNYALTGFSKITIKNLSVKCSSDACEVTQKTEITASTFSADYKLDAQVSKATATGKLSLQGGYSLRNLQYRLTIANGTYTLTQMQDSSPKLVDSTLMINNLSKELQEILTANVATIKNEIWWAVDSNFFASEYFLLQTYLQKFQQG